MMVLNAMTAKEIYGRNLRNYFSPTSEIYHTFYDAFDIHCENEIQKEVLYRFTGSGRNNLLLLSFSNSFEGIKPLLEFDYVSIHTICKEFPKKANELINVCAYRDEERFEQIDDDTDKSTLSKKGNFLLSHAEDIMSIITVDERTIKVRVIEEG
jgi:hypothetical protein